MPIRSRVQPRTLVRCYQRNESECSKEKPMQYNSQNEQMKRKYEQYLTHSQGLGSDSVKVARRALAKYDEFSKHADYKTFNAQKAIDFKEYLREQGLAKTTHANCIKQMNKFFEWLAVQPGYRSKIKRDAVDYLNISHKEKQLLRTGRVEHTPTLENVRKLVESIQPITEVDQRDRALISFLCLTGMRDSAVATLPLKAFDANTLLIDQNPDDGVKTKFSKHIYSKMFRFDAQMVRYVLDWVTYLYKRGFSGADPMFPRSKNRKEEGNLSFQDAQEVEPVFWRDGTSVQRLVKQRSETAGLEYFHPHLYRHLAIQLALSKARSGEEIKARRYIALSCQITDWVGAIATRVQTERSGCKPTTVRYVGEDEHPLIGNSSR